MGRLILLMLIAILGFWYGLPHFSKKEPGPCLFHPEKDCAIREHKSFVVCLYAHNQALWCEKSLRSIFEQEYDHYRVIVIDDASSDQTKEIIQQFVVENNQESKVILMHNESYMGEVASLYRAIDSCLDREIMIPFHAKDRLVSPFVLQELNAFYQNSDVWMTHSPVFDYPSYEKGTNVAPSFYAALFKQIKLEDLYQKGEFLQAFNSYLFFLDQL